MATKKRSARKSQTQIKRDSRSKEDDAVRLRLIAARTAAKLSRRQMAEALGARPLSLKAWELGRFRTPMVVALAAEMWCELNNIDIFPLKKKSRAKRTESRHSEAVPRARSNPSAATRKSRIHFGGSAFA